MGGRPLNRLGVLDRAHPQDPQLAGQLLDVPGEGLQGLAHLAQERPAFPDHPKDRDGGDDTTQDRGGNDDEGWVHRFRSKSPSSRAMRLPCLMISIKAQQPIPIIRTCSPTMTSGMAHGMVAALATCITRKATQSVLMAV